jgi:S-adenosylmethionine-diacylglycerol 3-amino-3-carboxypropyl transferase
MGNFYSRLSYSFGNEDPNTEHRALRIQPKDRILCVTASGDRPLNLMTVPFKELITVDANPLQNALFDLKRVALSKLSFSDYMAFLGVKHSKDRKKIFKKLSKDLDPIITPCLGSLSKKIENGVLYAGSVEKLLKLASSFINTFRGKKIETLFAMNNLEQQRQFLSNHLQSRIWQIAFNVVLHPFVTRTFFRDPGLYEYVDPNIHVGQHLYTRLFNYLNRNLAKESVLLSLVLKGKVDPSHFPPYLTEKGVAKIKKQVGKSRFYTDNLIQFFDKTERDSFDCFSMSDIASYMNKENFHRLLEGIYKCARPNARFCIRQFLSNHQIPAHLAPYFKRDLSLEHQLKEEDRCFVYSFLTGTIIKP